MSTLRILDGVSHDDFHTRIFLQHWVAKYLGKDIDEAKVSVFANVGDSMYLQDVASNAKVNHQNMVVILHILQSMLDAKLLPEKIIVLTFYPEAAVAMRKFLKSQGITDIRVEHVDSDRIKSQDNQIAILDWPLAGDPEFEHRRQYERSPSQSIGEGLRKNKMQRLVSAPCVPRAVRVFVGSSSVLQFKYSDEWKNGTGNTLIMDLMESHIRDEQTKFIEIGDEILQHEQALRPGDYFLASDPYASAENMYQQLGVVQGHDHGNVDGEAANLPWRCRAVAAAAAAPRVVAPNMREWKGGHGHNGVGDDRIGDPERGWGPRPDVGNARHNDLAPMEPVETNARVERIRATNWRTGA